jgi:hypothetical protein
MVLTSMQVHEHLRTAAAYTGIEVLFFFVSLHFLITIAPTE